MKGYRDTELEEKLIEFVKEFDFEEVANSKMTTSDPFDFSTPARVNTNDLLNPNNSLSDREIIWKL